jgi:hypothetical protein
MRFPAGWTRFKALLSCSSSCHWITLCQKFVNDYSTRKTARPGRKKFQKKLIHSLTGKQQLPTVVLNPTEDIIHTDFKSPLDINPDSLMNLERPKLASPNSLGRSHAGFERIKGRGSRRNENTQNSFYKILQSRAVDTERL